MKRKKSIQLKAAFLLIAFSLNMIIGFACSVGIDMEFNSHHHDGDETTILKTSHHHGEAADKDHHDSNDNKDNCCNDQVMKFSQIDKSVPQSLKTIAPTFLSAYVSSYYDNNILYTSYLNTSFKYFVRSYHPPIPDIRIAIRSFQI
jgi:hypothetical protein